MSELSRRSLIKGAGALGAAIATGTASTALARAAGAAPVRAAVTPGQRVAVIGGGMAGMETAWLLDGVHNVTLFEKDSFIGGHVHSLEVEVQGVHAWVDAGAQYFAPSNYPNFYKLVNTVLQVPIIACTMETTVFTKGAFMPTFASGQAWAFPITALAFFQFLTAAKNQFAGADNLGTGDWNITLQQWLDAQPLLPAHKQNLFYPLLAALNGPPIADNNRISARGAVAFIVRNAPANPLSDPVIYYNARDGLESVATAMINQLTTTTVLRNAPVTAITKVGSTFNVTANGQTRVFDHIVLALPPVPAAPLVAPLGSGGPALAAIYNQFEYFQASTAIHTDPTYMPSDPFWWSAYNARLDGPHCEATMWYGGIQDQLAGLPIFKSWTTHRAEQPTNILATANYLHPNITPQFIAAQQLLAAKQGQNNIWFAGTHTYDLDSQESAIVSAAKVCLQLAPTSSKLAALSPVIKEVW